MGKEEEGDRVKNGLIADLKEDLNKLKVSEWRTVCQNRSDWRRILEEAKGLHCLES